MLRLKFRRDTLFLKTYDYKDVQGVVEEIVLPVKTVMGFTNEYESQRYNSQYCATITRHTTQSVKSCNKVGSY